MFVNSTVMERLAELLSAAMTASEDVIEVEDIVVMENCCTLGITTTGGVRLEVMVIDPEA